MLLWNHQIEGVILIKKRAVEHKEATILEIQQELSKSPAARYYHRLHLVLLVVNGMPAREVAALYNESSSTLNHWTKKVLEEGSSALQDEVRSGRPSRLNEEQLQQLCKLLEQSPEDFGYDQVSWDGLVLSQYIQDHYAITLQVRQCQRLMRQLGFTLQRPQSFPKGSSPDKESFKKNGRNSDVLS